MEISGVNDILHLLFSAKGLDNKVIVFAYCYFVFFISCLKLSARGIFSLSEQELIRANAHGLFQSPELVLTTLLSAYVVPFKHMMVYASS